jgi:hypothetical protein
MLLPEVWVSENGDPSLDIGEHGTEMYLLFLQTALMFRMFVFDL